MKFLQNIPFSLHGVVLMDQMINILTLNFTNICNVFICDCFSKLNSYCGHFSQKFHRCKKRVGLDSSKESKETVIVKSNMFSCFAWCSPKISTIFMVWTILLCTNLFKQHYVDASMIQQINWSWYLEYINAGYLSLTWLEFVVAVWEKSGNYFLWTLWQPCNYIHYDVRDDVTYPSSMFKCENRVWESSLMVASEFRVWISSPRIESVYRVRISSQQIEPENQVLEVWEWISNLIPHITQHMITYPC